MCLDYDEEDILDAMENEALQAEQDRVYESGIKRGCGA
jgi:hypothetical protein